MEEAMEQLAKQGYTFETSTAPIPSIDSDDGSYAKLTLKHRGNFMVMLIAGTPQEAMESALILAREHQPAVS